MKLFFITLALTGCLFVMSSCKYKDQEAVVEQSDTTIIEDDEDLNLDDLLDDKDTSTDTLKDNKSDASKVATDNFDKPQRVKASASTVDPTKANKLMKYNVVVSTLSKQDGVARLSKNLDKDGINYFVVKSGGFYMFVVASSDSEAEAIKARKDFLLKTTVDKSRKQIWDNYEIEVTDSYILERK